MDQNVMDLQIRQWITVFETQAKSGLNKNEWCALNGINRGAFFRWQKRVRSYLLEHGENSVQMQDMRVTEQADNTCFVELPCTRPSDPEPFALRNFHDDDVLNEASPINIHYGGFSIHVDSEVNERQLAAVLRAVKNAD